MGHPALVCLRGVCSLADVLVPVFQVFLQLGHELAGVGSVDDAVIEAQGETDDAADRDRIGAVLIGNYRRFFKEAAYTQNGRFRLIDDRSSELLAEDSGIRNREGARSYFFRLQLLARALSARSTMARAMPRKLLSSAWRMTGTINPQSRATAMPRLMFLW